MGTGYQDSPATIKPQRCLLLLTVACWNFRRSKQTKTLFVPLLLQESYCLLISSVKGTVAPWVPKKLKQTARGESGRKSIKLLRLTSDTHTTSFIISDWISLFSLQLQLLEALLPAVFKQIILFAKYRKTLRLLLKASHSRLLYLPIITLPLHCHVSFLRFPLPLYILFH